MQTCPVAVSCVYVELLKPSFRSDCYTGQRLGMKAIVSVRSVHFLQHVYSVVSSKCLLLSSVTMSQKECV